ncbi:hypothetical protein TIFTF001_030614 [Ficus carica]|uniref:Uncharacterized protein n=1 Tax=Ficus carica TaxID=3494 RepID=A0AA88J568_FICCA|nr:hypothetical protein TIFTF001_030614 [Ficus carica]
MGGQSSPASRRPWGPRSRRRRGGPARACRCQKRRKGDPDRDAAAGGERLGGEALSLSPPPSATPFHSPLPPSLFAYLVLVVFLIGSERKKRKGKIGFGTQKFKEEEKREM